MQSSLKPASIVLLALLLASCGTPPKPLPPEEVLRRAIIRSSAIESASVSASASILLKGYSSFSGSAVIQGVLRGTGSWSADVSFQGRDSAGHGRPASGRVRAVSLDGSQVFIKPDSLQGDLLEAYAKTLTGSLSGWWYVGQPAGTPPGGRRTLAPAELNQAAAMFRIDSSSGPEPFADSGTAYRISVTLTPDAVAALFAGSAKPTTAAYGTLVVDAADFTLIRATWNLRDVLTSFGPADIALDVALGDINRAPEIVLPSGSSAALPLNGVFATISH